MLRARWHEVEDGVNWAPRAEGVTAVEVVPGLRRRRAGVKPRRHAHRRERVAGPNAGGRHRATSIAASEGTRLSYMLLRLGSRAGARGHAGAGAARQLDVFRARLPSASSRCWSARRCACGVRAIRRRCISSGCASRSSAPSRSPSTDRWIAWTGCSTGATRSRRRFCRRCSCISCWSFPSGPRRGPAGRGLPAQLVVPLLYLPALALGAGRILALDARRRRTGRCFRARSSLLDRAAARVSVRLRRRGARRPGAGVPRADVADGAAAAALDCVGHGVRRRRRSRSATRCRGRSASIRRSRCSSRPSRSGWCR